MPDDDSDGADDVDDGGEEEEEVDEDRGTELGTFCKSWLFSKDLLSMTISSESEMCSADMGERREALALIAGFFGPSIE